MKRTIMFTAILACLFAIPNVGKAQKDNTKETEFKYVIDEFADIKVMRYKIPNWDDLSIEQQEYLYYLAEAAKCGRDILWDQHYKYNLTVRRTLENILSTYKGKREGKEWDEFVVYAKRVFFSNGIHHHYSEDKIMPTFSKAFFQTLITSSTPNTFPLNKGEKINVFSSRITDIIFNPKVAPVRKETDKTRDIVANSAVNFYEGVTREEAEKFYNEKVSPDANRPLSYGLNSKLMKEDGKIIEKTYKVGGMYSEAIKEVLHWLEKAAKVAENENQRNYIKLLIEYYKTGDLKTWDDYNVAWASDIESQCDFVNGFIENYIDPLGMKSSWEAVVNFKDLEATKRTEIISNNAQWFEDHSPIAQEYKKKEVKGVSAKVINAVMLGGDCYPTPPIGINLPNADWIRKEYGSKSVTIANISSAYDLASLESPKGALQEFAASEEEIELAKKYSSLSGDLHTDMHECLGHGSGQLLEGTPSGALADYSSSLEEARADLFALYYMMDPYMIEIGLIPDLGVGRAAYDSYLRNGLLTQYARIEFGKTVNQAHMQARKLISTYAFERGQESGAVIRFQKGGKTYFQIKDHNEVRKIFGELLAKIQDIKSRGDYEAGKDLIDKYAVKIEPVLHQEIIDRYKKLNIKPYGGFVNPEITPVANKEGKIIKYELSYPKDFLKQHLQYGKHYSFLPTIN
ncbi:MAG: dihydrofolate reductase [Bacteroidales bacterium]|nr:dihydrofolate reductase [Bacteroidales bacterium]MDD4685566.1 dihydrofolate reductase [Bacteroidales bacterium]